MYHDLSCYLMYFLHLATHFKTQPKKCFGFGFLFFFFVIWKLFTFFHVNLFACAYV